MKSQLTDISNKNKDIVSHIRLKRYCLSKETITLELMEILSMSIYTKYVYYGPFVKYLFSNFMPILKSQTPECACDSSFLPHPLLCRGAQQPRFLNAMGTAQPPHRQHTFPVRPAHVSPNVFTFPQSPAPHLTRQQIHSDTEMQGAASGFLGGSGDE